MKRGRYNLEDSPWRNPHNPDYRKGLITARESIDLFDYDLVVKRQVNGRDLVPKLPDVQGKVLACWCKPGPCHGDVIVRLADALDSNARETPGGLAMSEIEKTGPLSLDTLAQMINTEHRAFIGSAQKTLEHGLRAGELLAQAKSQCQHGEWLGWLEKNFVGVPRTAQSYMQLHNNRDAILAKAQDSAHLTIEGALKAIASPKGPESPLHWAHAPASAPHKESANSIRDQVGLTTACPYCGASGKVPAGTSESGRALSMPCPHCSGTGIDVLTHNKPSKDKTALEMYAEHGRPPEEYDDPIPTAPGGDGNAPPVKRVAKDKGAIEQMLQTEEGTREFARINQEFADGQARDRVLRRLSDLKHLMSVVPPEDVARDVVARYVGESAESAVLGRPTYGFSTFDVENAQDVHAWIERYLEVLEEANAHFRKQQEQDQWFTDNADFYNHGG